MHFASIFFVATLQNILVRGQQATTSPIGESTSLPTIFTDETVDSNVTDFAKHWGWNNCNDRDKEAILGGLGEAHSILATDGCFGIGNHWGDYALVEYLGSPKYMQKHRAEVETNFFNAFSYQQHWYGWSYTHVYCHDNSLYQDDCANDPGSIVVKNDFNGNGLALLFCNHWFSLPRLKDAYSGARGGKYPADISQYDSRARPWITAMMLVKTIGTFPSLGGKPRMGYRKIKYPDNPFRDQYVLGAAQAKYLAKHVKDLLQNVKIWSNADNWAWYALATYVQGRIGEYPQRPLVPKELPPSPLSLLFGLGDKANLEADDENMLQMLAAEYGISQNVSVQEQG